MNLQTRIQQIVHEHSGGVKLVELVTELACQDLSAGKDGVSAARVLMAVEKDSTLNSHSYAWHMAEDVDPELPSIRIKVFVHQV